MSSPDLRETLAGALATVHLEGRLEAAFAWCEENGAYALDELADEDVFTDFAADLGLKRLEAKRLLKAFEDAAGITQASPSSGLGAGASKDPALSPAFAPAPRGGFFPGLPGQAVVVKNTFLDYDRPTATELAGHRANTMPVNFTQIDDEDEEDEDDGAEASAEVEDRSEGRSGVDPSLFVTAQSVTAGSSSHLKCKLTTFDAYESSSYWDWQGEIPNIDPSMDVAASASAPENQTAAGAESANNEEIPVNTVYVPMPVPMMGMSPMMFPMMNMGLDPADAAQAQVQMQMQMAMGGMMMGQGCQGMEAMVGPVADPKPRSQVMERVFSMASQRERIRWTVDSRKLKSSDREAVSPTFEVSCGGVINFKMVLKPKVMDSMKGGACFKKSRNKGFVELRCVTELESAGDLVKPMLTFRLQAASAKRSEPFRGPVRHNFAERAICGLPEGQDEWDFGKVVDHSNNTFQIVLELLKDDT